MKRNAFWDAMACAGAVIGAGFASGRETIVFFSRYGGHAYWLIVLAVVMMMCLCALCMRVSHAQKNTADWSGIMKNRLLPKAMSVVLMMMTAGAMISAAGHMTALVWNWKKAYAFGALGTLMMAWILGFRSMKPLSLFSMLLTAALLVALIVGYSQPKQMIIQEDFPSYSLSLGAAKAVGYAAMNMALAIGVVCSCATGKGEWWTVILFGGVMGVLLLLSSCLYSRHPEWLNEPFPFVKLYAAYGRKGYVLSVTVLYLSILTTLISVIYGLRTAVEAWTCSRSMQILLVLAMPMALSRLGFGDIVDRLYAPAGWACTAVIFVPMLLREYKRHRTALFP